MASLTSYDFELVLPLCLFLAGVLVHLFYFRHGEHHMYGVRYIQCLFAIPTLITVALNRALRYTILRAITTTSIGTFATLSGIFASLLVYRMFWHPLRNIPGPFAARISSLWFSTLSRRADAHKQLLYLHRRYGPFVRIGPCDVSIASPSGTDTVYGLKSACTKGTWYDEDWPRQSVHTTRDPVYHRQRRRVWSNAFSDRAIRNYETRVNNHNDQLVAHLQHIAGAPIDASHWTHWWAFDVMGDLTFGKDFGMMQNAKGHWAVDLFCEAMELQALHLPTWLIRVLVAIPGMADKYWKFIHFCDEAMLERVRIGERSDTGDLSSTLIPHLDKALDKEAESRALLADSRTAIVAGSDTTASALVHVLYYLAKDPNHVAALREELMMDDDTGGKPTNVQLSKLDYLTGVINEALRLHPVVPSIMPRKTPKEGIFVGEQHIPGETTVFCPQYVLARDNSIYADAEKFLPQRWSTSGEMTRDKSSYAPFSTGIYACIGRPLALMQLRTVITALITSFDLELAPGETGKTFIDETKDHFTTAPASIQICFKPRTSVK